MGEMACYTERCPQCGNVPPCRKELYPEVRSIVNEYNSYLKYLILITIFYLTILSFLALLLLFWTKSNLQQRERGKGQQRQQKPNQQHLQNSSTVVTYSAASRDVQNNRTPRGNMTRGEGGYYMQQQNSNMV